MAHRKKLNVEKVEQKVVEKPLVKQPPITPLTQRDGSFMQEMVDLSNTYASLLKQYNQYRSMIDAIKKRVDQFKKGELKPPIIIAISRNKWYAESDREKILKSFDGEIRELEVAKQAIIGILEHRRDEFTECVIRVHRLLGEKIKDKELPNITRLRGVDGQTKIDEQKLLEKELDSILESNK